jgi:hypothetical protein
VSTRIRDLDVLLTAQNLMDLEIGPTLLQCSRITRVGLLDAGFDGAEQDGVDAKRGGVGRGEADEPT